MSGPYTKVIEDIKELIDDIRVKQEQLLILYGINNPSTFFVPKEKSNLDYGETIVKESAQHMENVTGMHEERFDVPYLLSRKQFNALMEELDKKTEAHRETATNDYASEEDVFDNFKRIGALLEIPPRKVLMVYLLKHMDSIIRYVNGKESKRENINGRNEDAINYLKLLWAWIEFEGK